MFLDPHTLLVINVVNLLGLALLLPMIMGRTLSKAARAARYSLIVHASAWIAVILSEMCANYGLNLLLSTLSMCCYSGCNWLLFQALTGWLGPRRYGRLLCVLSVAMPIGYALMFASYEWRVGWANFLIAMQVAIVAAALLRSSTNLSGRWRYALCACLSLMAVLTLMRGVLGAFYSALYPSFAAPHPVNILSLVVANLTMVLGNVCLLVAWREEAEQQLERLVITDPLTCLLNRRGWGEQAERVFTSTLRCQQPLALLSIDLDHFKTINDRYGHEVGDRALQFFSDQLRAQQGAGDVIARIGGEEFCVLMPMAGDEAAQRFDRQLRAALAQEAVPALGIPLHFSAGLTYRQPTDTSLHHLLHRSDAALYEAKWAGRDQLIVHTMSA